MPAESFSSSLSNTARARHRNPLPAWPVNPCCHHKIRRPELVPAGRGSSGPLSPDHVREVASMLGIDPATFAALG